MADSATGFVNWQAYMDANKDGIDRMRQQIASGLGVGQPGGYMQNLRTRYGGGQFGAGQAMPAPGSAQQAAMLQQTSQLLGSEGGRQAVLQRAYGGQQATGFDSGLMSGDSYLERLRQQYANAVPDYQRQQQAQQAEAQRAAGGYADWQRRVAKQQGAMQTQVATEQAQARQRRAEENRRRAEEERRRLGQGPEGLVGNQSDERRAQQLGMTLEEWNAAGRP